MPIATPNWINADDSFNDDSTSIAFIIIENFSMISLSAAIEPIHLANKVAGRNLYSYTVLTEDGQRRKASNGIEVVPTGCFENAKNIDIIVVCGGSGINHQDHSSLQRFLRRCCAHGSQIGAVHTGTYVLVKAGVLGTHKAAIHWEYLSSLSFENAGLLASERAFEIDKTRFTSAGGIATVDMMITIISRDHGLEIASKVADHLIHRFFRNSGDLSGTNARSGLGISHPKLVKVIGLMESAMSEPLSGPDLAHSVHMSTRQLERLFRKYMGCSPSRYYIKIRLEHARRFIQQTNIPILTIALECGFLSASHFSKAYVSHFGMAPSADRRTPRF